jgi:acyl-CoA thioesterase-2
MTDSLGEHPDPTLERLVALDTLGPRRFQSHAHQTNRNGVLYGGQLVTQALAAAMLTVRNRQPHSMHLSFQAPGSALHPVVYDVEFTRDGGSLSTRRVHGTQPGTSVLFATISFSDTEQGFVHEQAWCSTPPPPESLSTLADLEARYAHRVSAHGRGRLRCYPQVDVRPLNPEEHLLLVPGGAQCRYWIRARIAPGSDPVTRFAAMGYLSDYLLVNAALVPHAAELPPSRLFVASLDHTICFHGAGDPSDWLLYETHSPWAGAGLVLCHGRFYSRDGRLVASTSQQALVRPLTPSAATPAASSPAPELRSSPHR